MDCGSNFKSLIFEHMSWIKFSSISCEMALRGIPDDNFDDIMISQHCPGNGLVPSGTKPLPESTLTQILATMS